MHECGGKSIEKYILLMEFWPLRWLEYDHEELPISMDLHAVLKCNMLSVDPSDPRV